MNMIEIFKTDVSDIIQKEDAISRLLLNYPHHMITLDLEDCDRILRVEGNYISIKDIVIHLNALGHSCIHLPVDL